MKTSDLWLPHALEHTHRDTHTCVLLSPRTHMSTSVLYVSAPMSIRISIGIKMLSLLHWRCHRMQWQSLRVRVHAADISTLFSCCFHCSAGA